MTAAELASDLEARADFIDRDRYDECMEIKETPDGRLLRQAAARLRSMEERLVKMEWHMSRIAIRTEFFDPGSPPDVIHQEARAALSGEGQ